MSILKCKMCGGNLEVADGASVCECDYCGTKQTVSTANDENLQGLFNRANTLRIKSEFDKAEAIYEKILQVKADEAEAYWGLILCKYGIEYVEDPATFKRIPTCHRTSFDSVIADEDYKSAVLYGDAVQRTMYESEAAEIDRLQKEILALSQKEDPYDVFICYKESDDGGKRTVDSAIANDIYYQLTQEGFKVFYSAITLEDKLGSAYEPCIFAALNSAKVMLVIGTKPEYFNAVWVKNEWSRYLKMMKKDRSKTLIPCYKDMDAYELPDEFAHLQAQDMSKIGFINDITRGIKKVLGNTAPAKEAAQPAPQTASSSNTSALLERAFMFLEDGSWNEANEYCEKVLDQEPKNASAYLGKLMAELHVKKQDDLKYCDTPFDSSSNYQKAVRFGDAALAQNLKDCVETVNDRNENARLAKEEADKKEAERKAEERRIAAEKAAKKIKKTLAIVIPIVIVAIAAVVLAAKVFVPNSKYNAAVELMNVGKYDEAITAFEAMNGYKDSGEKITEAKYNNAVALMNAEQYDDAISVFEVLGDYKDSAEMIEKIYTENPSYKIRNAEVGDYIQFGSFEQDNDESNGKEDIEWLVIDKQDNKILVISKYALLRKTYSVPMSNLTWEKCNLHKWLNNSFLQFAFSADEQERIVTTNVRANENPKYNTNFGNANDKVFLLSITEAEKYFPTDESRKCAPTAYAKAKGAVTSDNNKTESGEDTCWWWLRSPGITIDNAAVVRPDGLIGYTGSTVIRDDATVRPAMWINIGE